MGQLVDDSIRRHARVSLARKIVEIVEAEQSDAERRGPKGYDDEFNQGRYEATSTVLAALRELFQKEGIKHE